MNNNIFLNIYFYRSLTHSLFYSCNLYFTAGPEYAEVVSMVKLMTGKQVVQGWRSYALRLREVLGAEDGESLTKEALLGK